MTTVPADGFGRVRHLKAESEAHLPGQKREGALFFCLITGLDWLRGTVCAE